MEGKFDFITSDHSPCPPSMKDTPHIFEAWEGINGGQFTLASVIGLAMQHDISFTEVAKWIAMNPAKRFNLQQKGKIEVGMDADLAIISWQDAQVTAENSFAKHKQSIYMYHTFPCQITHTLCNGELIFEHNKIVSVMQGGEWLAIKDVCTTMVGN